MEGAISLQDIQKILKKRLLLIITLIIIGASIAIGISYYILTPIYQAKTQILINQNNNSIELLTLPQRESDFQLINTYNDIITSEYILSKVVEDLKINVTPEQLSNQITLTSETNSKVLTIRVTDSDPNQAVKIANTTVGIFKKEIKSLMKMDNINILSTAKLSDNPSPIKPDKLLNIAVGAIIGLLSGIGLAFLLEILDTTIKNEKDVEEFLGIPIMGIVGSIPVKENKSSFKSREMRGNKNAWIEN